MWTFVAAVSWRSSAVSGFRSALLRAPSRRYHHGLRPTTTTTTAPFATTVQLTSTTDDPATAARTSRGDALSLDACTVTENLDMVLSHLCARRAAIYKDWTIDAYEEALSIYTKRRDGDEDEDGGGDDPRRHLVDVAVTLNNIGEVHRKLGRYDLAMQAYQRGLSHTIAVLGPNHRNVAATLHNVASVHTGRGDHAKALDLYRRVLALQRQTLGDGHLDVATTMSSMGEVYEQRGTVAESPEERTDKYSKALKLYKKALRARRQAVGEDHVYVAFTLLQLGRFHRVRDGNRAEAVRRYSEALSVYRNNNLDERHPYVRVVVKERALIPIE